MEAPLILSVETSGKTGGVAIFKEKLLGEINLSAKESYSKILFHQLPNLLTTTGTPLESIDYIAVDVGPGSFTGLRIGLSVVKALHLVYRTKIIALSSLEVLAFRFFPSSTPVLSVIDAYTGEVFFAIYSFDKDRIIPLIEPRLSKIEDLPKYVDFPVIVASETPEKWCDQLNNLLGNKVIIPPFAVSLRASTLAELAYFKLKRGEANLLSGEEVLPLYLKSSEAERKRCSAIS